MKTRAITGFFFILVLVGAVLLGPYSFVPFFSLIGLLSVWEFYRIVARSDVQPMRILGVGFAFIVLAVVATYVLGIAPALVLLVSIVPFFSVYILALFRKTVNPINDISYTLMGVIYAGVPFAFFIALGFLDGTFNPYIPLGFLILLWTNDTGAYLSGRSFGRTKLFERISPNKTWEGFVGGVVLAAVVGLNLAQYFDGLTRWQWVVMALIIGVFGTLGDLVESMLKRNVGVKDSGSILPGHGGFLDRFDGLLVAAPLVYLFLKVYGQCI
ncbi:phosphatidate cytidylyltransferase [Sphingobacterium psychroaquaticum]|uniref:phosphatidate cytidylyltransferase n=1 Tax=Sphingobacterium psychroaquaticum TaxID=561061 RepID=UPI00106B2F0F|nr:phosphatidate cytidylyltransferase [Sphingobacterium psychroaquaticum]QBQ42923.1 phosphatidate cytidylyltransferase [Sphingobacterium psychroaquaticum]